VCACEGLEWGGGVSVNNRHVIMSHATITPCPAAPVSPHA